MISRFRVWSGLHTFIWLGLGAAFLWCSLPKLHLQRWGSIGPATSFYSTDFYLRALIGRSDASERILQTLAPLPRNKEVILFLPDTGQESRLVVLIVVYLSWPREVRWLPVTDSEVERKLISLNPRTLAALIFWDVSPPHWLPAGVPLSPEQVIVPMRSISPPEA